MRAVTRCRLLAAGGGRSLLEVRLETGRRHQIRVHLAGTGHPIAGDGLYGGGKAPRLMLHAWSLGFAHPTTGRMMRLASPPEKAFFDAVGADASVLPAEQPRETPAAPAGDRPAERPAAEGWDNVAPWYEQLVGDRRSDYHEQLVLPGVLRLLGAAAGQRVLDVACGEGVLCRRLTELGVQCVGVDASEQLIDAARRQVAHLPREARPRFYSGDARRLASLPALDAQRGQFDAAACVLALMNIDPIEPVAHDVAAMLRAQGRFVVVLLHPAFRAPGRTSWQRETLDAPPAARPPAARRPPRGKAREPVARIRQYRRVDAYLSAAHRAIVMNPGEVAGGRPAVTTTTWHRPLQTYVNALAESGLLVDALEEWASHRTSGPGPHAAELDRSRREIPMFLALRARKV
ncbi:MAG: methyltransferase domain-containing protein [Planctomycetes bacterium]|nr:methyltransferase domain-containing protein [Planctomycetota bacterium]